jgi:geranylgeranyl pyrophosphate synthase
MLFADHIDKHSAASDSQKIWAAVIEMLHVASLVHDDILDASDTRRGLPSSHTIYGKHRATFSANYLIGRAYLKM